MGQKPDPYEHPNPQLDQNGWCTYPKMVPLALTHSHMVADPVSLTWLALAVCMLYPSGTTYLVAVDPPRKKFNLLRV